MSAIENGRTGISAVRLTELARILGVSTDDLLAPSRPAAEEGPGRVVTDGSDWRVYRPLALDAPLVAAFEAFLEVGYHGATMRDIARRAELSVPGVYHHYASKQEMLLTILELTMNDLMRRCEVVLAEQVGPLDRFCALVENSLSFTRTAATWASLEQARCAAWSHQGVNASLH